MRNYIKSFLAFLHSDEMLGLAAVIVGAAYLTEEVFATPGSQLAIVAGKILKAGVMLGITSSIGRAKKEKADEPSKTA